MRSFLLDHPRPLVVFWQVGSRLLRALRRSFCVLGMERSSRWVGIAERPLKVLIFDCRMCGQCVLHSTGMTCPMTCPKQLRNGPCGGVCRDGKCEVDETMDCVWVKAVERSALTPYADEIHSLNPPLDWRLEGLSSWVTFAMGRDRPTFGGDAERLCAWPVEGPRRDS